MSESFLAISPYCFSQVGVVADTLLRVAVEDDANVLPPDLP